MPDKKPYSAPQLVTVELNHEQAVLSTCSLTYATLMASGAGTRCVNGGCKIGGTGTNNAARAS